MRTFALVPEGLRVFHDRGAAIEGADPDIWHILGKTGILVFDLKGEFTGVAENEHRDLAVDRFKLLETRQDEDCRFAMTGLCLTQDVHSENSLGYTLLLDWLSGR